MPRKLSSPIVKDGQNDTRAWWIVSPGLPRAALCPASQIMPLAEVYTGFRAFAGNGWPGDHSLVNNSSPLIVVGGEDKGDSQMDYYLSVSLALLKRRLYSVPVPGDLIMDAKTIMTLYPREIIPDWVEILANGNPGMIESVVEVAKEDIAAEAKSRYEDGQAQAAALVPIMLLLLLAVLVVMALVPHAPPAQINSIAVDLSSSHGEAKHHDAAVMVHTCILKKGVMQEWINLGLETDRRARICEIQPGKYGIQVIENKDGTWREVTAFIKDKMTSIDQVMRYLSNAGYTLIEDAP